MIAVVREANHTISEDLVTLVPYERLSLTFARNDLDEEIPRFWPIKYKGQDMHVETQYLAFLNAETLEDTFILQNCIDEIRKHKAVLFLQKDKAFPTAYLFENEINMPGLLSLGARRSLFAVVALTLAKEENINIFVLKESSTGYGHSLTYMSPDGYQATQENYSYEELLKEAKERLSYYNY